MAYANEGRGSFDARATGVFYTQQHYNFDDLDEGTDFNDDGIYPQFIQYYQEIERPRPSFDFTTLGRMGPRASLASLSHTLKRGKG